MNSLVRVSRKTTSRLCISGPLWGNSLVIRFPSQRASNAESVYLAWCHNAVSFSLPWAHYGALLGVDALLMSITSVAGLWVLIQYSSMWPQMKRKLDITTTINTYSTAIIKITCLFITMALSWGGELDRIWCLFFCASFLPFVHISLDTSHAWGVLFWPCDI